MIKTPPDGTVYLIGLHWGLTEHAAVHAAELVGTVPGLRITSGHRTPERNRTVGGVENSFHLQGRAIDLGGSRAAIRQGLAEARAWRCSPRCSGPIEALDEKDHLHAAW